MTGSRRFDVLVAGSGPAGAATALSLARLGMAVLLADDGGAPGSDYDVLVSGQAQRGLASLGLPMTAMVHPVEVIRLHTGTPRWRSIAGAGGGVCGIASLRDRLRGVAAASGVAVIAGRVTRITQVAGGHAVAIAGGSTGVTSPDVVARHVVIATGAAASGSLPPRAAAHGLGTACAQRFAGARLRGQMMLAMAAPAAADPQAPPTCVWALPGRDGTVTVAAARIADPSATRPAALLGAAVDTLAAADRRFAALSPAGPLVSGPLDAGFSPERVTTAGCLLVGDAAGLVNPFTGEGLTYAVQSGLLAAGCIAEHPSDPGRARQAYARRLAAGFVGYFETARHAARRYHLTWRVLSAGAGSDHPFFAKARRAILLPEGLTGLTPLDHLRLPGKEAAMLAPFLAACDEVAIMTIRDHWPFLARLMLAGDLTARPRLRPAVLFFAGLQAGGRMPDIRQATVGAAIELAQLGALAFLTLPAASDPPRRGIDWVGATTVLAGDFLLAQASRLVAEAAPGISWSFADWLSELAALRASRLARTPPRASAGAVFASLFEFPARIGALLGGGSAGTVAALREAGYHCGHAFLHAEDVLALRGERTRLDTTLQVMLRSRISAIPESLDAGPGSHRRLAADAGLRSTALNAAVAACLAAQRNALDAVTPVASPATERILRGFVSAVAAPALAAAGPAGETGSDETQPPVPGVPSCIVANGRTADHPVGVLRPGAVPQQPDVQIL